MSEQCMVSVVMPAYNCERFIAEAIESVLFQTHQNLELIVIDDCSKDGTAEVVQRFAERDERVKFVQNQTNQGVARTRNRGIDESKGEYIAFLDSDDVWRADKLELQLKLAKRTGAGILYSSYDMIDENGREIKTPFIAPKETNYQKMLGRSDIGNSTVMVHKAQLGQHRFLHGVHHEDYALWMELLSIPVKAAGCAEILMHYRLVNGSRNDSRLRAAVQRWKVYRNVLHMGMWKSTKAFISYSIGSVIKHYVSSR